MSAGVSNLSGVVSVTNSVLANAYGSGIDIYNESGTIRHGVRQRRQEQHVDGHVEGVTASSCSRSGRPVGRPR